MKRTAEHLFSVIQRPHLSEKTVAAAGENGSMYVFRVAPAANKTDVKVAVEKIFGNAVSRVRIVNVKSKPRRFGGVLGKTKGWKKAYVTFAEGVQIDLETLKI